MHALRPCTDVGAVLAYLWDEWGIDDDQAQGRFRLTASDLIVLRYDVPPASLIQHCLRILPLTREQRDTFAFAAWWLHTPPYIQAYIRARSPHAGMPAPRSRATPASEPDAAAINAEFATAANHDAESLDALVRLALFPDEADPPP